MPQLGIQEVNKGLEQYKLGCEEKEIREVSWRKGL
jgi:hypothetical protein